MTIICNCAVWRRRRRSLCDPSALCRKLILSCNQTNRTAPKRENIQQKATKKKKRKENQIVVECSSKIKYPVSRAASIEVCTYSCDNFIRTATAATLCCLFYSYRVLLKPGKRFGECLQLIFIQSLVFILKNNLAFVCIL